MPKKKGGKQGGRKKGFSFDITSVTPQSGGGEGRLVKEEKQAVKSEEVDLTGVNPPSVVTSAATVSQASTLTANDYSMTSSQKGKNLVFNAAVRDALFPKLKFFPSASDDLLEFSLEETTVCGLLREECGVSEEDAAFWWKNQHTRIKKILTDKRNNVVKVIAEKFMGKLDSTNISWSRTLLGLLGLLICFVLYVVLCCKSG